VAELSTCQRPRILWRRDLSSAAETVLRSANKPLTADEITEIALRRGLLQTKGKTPAATMSAALYGAPPESPIRREFKPGRQRALRASVRWTYDKKVR
jgi:hypothetical protein